MSLAGMPFIVISNIAIIITLVIFIILQKSKIDRWTLSGVAFIIAGGVGNVIDRIFRGFVIDYIDFSELINFPVFNFADICIVVRSGDHFMEVICK